MLDHNHGVLRRSDHPHDHAPLKSLVRRGVLEPVLPGTYVDTRRMDQRVTRYRAVLSHYRGATLWGNSAVGLVCGRADEPYDPAVPIEIAVPYTLRTPEPIKSTFRRLPDEVILHWQGLRMPVPAYLAVDAAACDDGRLAERLLRDRIVTPDQLTAALGWFRGQTGAATRRAVVQSSADNPWSGGERRFQRLLRAGGLRDWVANAPLWVDGHLYYPDILFRLEQVILEFDGYAAHRERHAFDNDRVRMNRLQLAGFLVLRFTWSMLDEPEAVLADVRRALQIRREIAA